jgi:hypothetical protein
MPIAADKAPIKRSPAEASSSKAVFKPATAAVTPVTA